MSRAILSAMTTIKSPGASARWQLDREDGSTFCSDLSDESPAVTLERDYKVLGKKHPLELAVGEVTKVKYQLTGRDAVYLMKRTPDAPKGASKKVKIHAPAVDPNADVPVKPQAETLPGVADESPGIHPEVGAPTRVEDVVEERLAQGKRGKVANVTDLFGAKPRKR